MTTTKKTGPTQSQMWNVDKRTKQRKLKPLYVLHLRLSTGLTQEQAAAVVHTSRRTWRKWEGLEGTQNHRYMAEWFVELFCLKQGLAYPLKFSRAGEEEAA